MPETNTVPEREPSVWQDIGYIDPQAQKSDITDADRPGDVQPSEPTAGDSSKPWKLDEETRALGHESLPSVRKIIKDHPMKYQAK